MEWGHHHRHWVLKSSFPAAVGTDLPLSPWDSTPAAYSDVTQASSHWPWPWTDILPLAHLWRQQLMFASQRRTEKEPLLLTRVFLGYSLCWNPLAEESEKQNLHVLALVIPESTEGSCCTRQANFLQEPNPMHR